jgi:hypothetical protein
MSEILKGDIQQLDLTSLQPGIYIISINSEGLVFTKKHVKR